MHYRQLGQCGVRVSELGFGGPTLGNVYGRIEEPRARRLVHQAFDAGITLFDVRVCESNLQPEAGGAAARGQPCAS